MAPGFAHPFTNTEVLLSRFESCPHPGQASNDNGRIETTGEMLDAALRHFAEHGLSAASEARDKAEEAFFAGDTASYDWWLAICRILDRRIAYQIGYEVDRKSTPVG